MGEPRLFEAQPAAVRDASSRREFRVGRCEAASFGGTLGKTEDIMPWTGFGESGPAD
jgi:hypothetical protein